MPSLLEPSSLSHREKRNLTDQQRREILEILFSKSASGKLKRGCLKEVAAMYSVDPRTVRQIVQKANSCIAKGLTVDVSPNLRGRVGRKRVQLDLNKIAALPYSQRTNIRSIAEALEVPRTTIHRRVKDGVMRPHTNPLKPCLSEEGKRARLQFCLSMLEPSSLQSQPTFKNMYNYVHIDEKWFFMTKESERYYLLPHENEPLRTCKSKHFITKVMFLAAVARPRFDTTRNQEFSGKIGIFPFTYKEPAKRTSKNRVAGTLETKVVVSVTKEIIRKCLIEKVLPAIRAKWPRGNGIETILIQQDNARPHIREFDAEFLEEASKDGFDIRLSFQPPNSPDLNVLDLGFFRAIQSLQYQKAPKNIDELVSVVVSAFEELSPQTLDNVFLTLQACMIEIMKVNGGIGYKVPHIGKGGLMRDDNLPTQLQCDHDLVESVMAHLQNGGN
ncbi:hypothetical protein RHSIM_Rhsim03G0157600 [Rhododendron simsii]|uniref:DUF7769 domain-containing protein n=1 Tax=Rhododendron simsii TaxID=118357 RepID=A0A834LPB9_RHOSS|nr:hypothetical protein RHSIM_Rhsim03G0157600 [Rhododendron simsii]